MARPLSAARRLAVDVSRASPPPKPIKASVSTLSPRRSGSPLHYTDHQKGQGRAFYEKACAMSLEGIVSKRADACRELQAMVETINADRAAQ